MVKKGAIAARGVSAEPRARPPPTLLRRLLFPSETRALSQPRPPHNTPQTGKKSRRGGTLDEIAEQLQLAKSDGGWKTGVSAMDDDDDGAGAGPSSTSPAAAAADMEMAEAVGAALKSRNNNKAARRKQKRQMRIGGALGDRLGAGGGGAGGGGGGGAMDLGEAGTSALTMTWPTTKGGVGKRTGKRGKRTARQVRRAAMAAERGTAAAERRVKRHVATLTKKGVRGQAKTLY